MFQVMGQPTGNNLLIVNNKEDAARYIQYIHTSENIKPYIYIMYLTCMCIKNSTVALTDSVEEKPCSLSFDSPIDTVPENCNKRKFNSDTKIKSDKSNAKLKICAKRKLQDSKEKNKKTINKKIAQGNINYSNRKITRRNISIVSTVKSNGNTFTVTEIAEGPKKKRKNKLEKLYS